MNKACQCLTAVILSISVISFHSCQKENSTENRENEIVSRVNKWLDSKKPADKAGQSANVDLLKEHLDFSKFRIEPSADGEKIIVIPVQDAFKALKDIDPNADPNLVMIFDRSGNVRKGNVVLYFPASGELNKDVPEGTFHDILNTAEPDCNGKFRYLSVTGKRLYELEYENKRLKSFGHLKDSSGSATGRTNNCVDWYWVYTWYDEFGQILAQEWEYIGTTCQGEDCYDPYAAMLCPMDNSGGGSGEAPDMGYEFAVSRPWKWDVAWTADWLAESYETVSGIKNSNEPQGGHFTNISHNSSYFSTALPGYTWQELGNTPSVDNPQRVYSSTTGKAIKSNGQFQVHSGSATRYFNQLF